MLRSGEEILADIDATLDQLIRNAETLEQVVPDTLFQNEMQALQKTQESLFARLVHMNDLLDEEQKERSQRKTPETCEGIEKKVEHFGKLHARILRTVAEDFKRAKKRQDNQPTIRKNRKKPF